MTSIARDGNTTAAIAATSGGSPFSLWGGVYLLTGHINNASGLTAVLQTISGDGASYVNCSTALAHVDGFETLYLPPGQYQWAVTGTAGASETFDLAVWRVPV